MTPNDSWGTEKIISFNADETALVELNNTYNPSNVEEWGVKMEKVEEETDTDGDGLSDSLEISGCTDWNEADSDGDGIVDGAEDANRNGVFDSDETDPCDADTDDDNIDDGMEDTNRNEVVDDGETAPKNPDTDGDGCNDDTDPTWMPVTYSNSTTVYGIVTMDSGQPAAEGDMVGAFVGDECRGVGNIVVDNGTAYVSLVIQGDDENETIQFKIFNHSNCNTMRVVQTL